MKKVLILTVTAGNGHNACAQVMKNKLEKMGDCEVKVIDYLKSFSNRPSVWVVDKGYNIAVSKFRHVYNFFYNYFLGLDPDKRFHCPAQGVARSGMSGLLREIYTFQPDVIYCTHFYPAMAITNLRLAYDIPAKVVVASLDYVNSPFWEACIGVDFLTLPNQDFAPDCERRGFLPVQLLPYGIPIDEKFFCQIDKAQARQMVGLKDDVFTILVMFGGGSWSGGYKNFCDLIKACKGRNVQIIVINGKDHRAFKKVAKKHIPQGISVLNVGFTKDVEKYMAASDVLVSKAGGALSTEAISMGLPLLVTRKVPGQEIYNFKYLRDKGVASSFKNAKQLRKLLDDLIDDSEKLLCGREKCAALQRNATAQLSQLLLSQPQATYPENCLQTDFAKVKKNVRKAVRRIDELEKINHKTIKREQNYIQEKGERKI